MEGKLLIYVVIGVDDQFVSRHIVVGVTVFAFSDSSVYLNFQLFWL